MANRICVRCGALIVYDPHTRYDGQVDEHGRGAIDAHYQSQHPEAWAEDGWNYK